MIVYKVCSAELWREAQCAGEFRGAPVDLTDGYIHFSTPAQLAETLAKHFAGQDDLVLLAVDVAGFGGKLKWEPSRGGALFPHLYGVMPLSAVTRTAPLPLDSSGCHVLPGFVA